MRSRNRSKGKSSEQEQTAGIILRIKRQYAVLDEINQALERIREEQTRYGEGDEDPDSR